MAVAISRIPGSSGRPAGQPVNDAALAGKKSPSKLLTSLDVIRYATVEGAKALKLDGKVGTLTPGKEADIILLDADAVNVAPLNHVPGAVVTLMERSNVDTVFVAGKARKWQGKLLDADRATTCSTRPASNGICSACRPGSILADERRVPAGSRSRQQASASMS